MALAVAGLALTVAFALVLRQRFETLPELIALHFNPFGEADLIGSRNDIFKLPLIGGLIWAANAVLAVVTSPLDRLLARAVLGTSIFVVLLLCVGAWRIVT